LIFVVALLAAATFFAIRSERKWAAYGAAGLNPLLTAFAIFLFFITLNEKFAVFGMLALCALTFALESIAAFLNLRSRRSEA
jgi:hypothetical protein